MVFELTPLKNKCDSDKKRVQEMVQSNFEENSTLILEKACIAMSFFFSRISRDAISEMS